MTADTALLTFIGSVLVALLGMAGVVYAARSSRAANARSEVTKTWQAQLDALQRAVDGARMRADSWRDDVEALRADRDEDRAKLKTLEAEMEQVKAGAARDRSAWNELLFWARSVYHILRRNELEFPPPPPGVSDTDPGLSPMDHA